MAAQGPWGGIRRAHVPHRGIPVPLQNAHVNGGRKISCNMAFCDHRDIAKGRKIKKGSIFLSFPFPTSVERLRKYPAIRNNVKKPSTIFPGEPGKIPGTTTASRREAPSCLSWRNKCWAPSFHFLLTLCGALLPCPQHDEEGCLPLPGHLECTCRSKGWQGVPNELSASGLSKKLWLAEGHRLVTPPASFISSSSPKCLLIEHQGCSKVFSS